MIPLSFTKIQATGNDFVVIDNREGRFTLDEMIQLTPTLCDRKFGVGADGSLFLCASSSCDFEMIYRNADGSDAGMCGNGGRALCLFAHRLGLGTQFTFSVHGVRYTGEILADAMISLGFSELRCLPTRLAGAEEQYYIFTGTDHLVVPVVSEVLADHELLQQRGKLLRYDARFHPKGTNVNFCSFSANQEIAICTYERGVEALTLACGTGSIACSIVDHYLRRPHLEGNHARYQVMNPGGMLEVSFEVDPKDQYYYNIFLKGEAQVTFTGVWGS